MVKPIICICITKDAAQSSQHSSGCPDIQAAHQSHCSVSSLSLQPKKSEFWYLQKKLHYIHLLPKLWLEVVFNSILTKNNSFVEVLLQLKFAHSCKSRLYHLAEQENLRNIHRPPVFIEGP